MVNENCDKNGLSTTLSLSQLYNDIDALLNTFRNSSRRNKYLSLTEVVKPASKNALMSGKTIIFGVFFGFALIATFILSSSQASDYVLLLEALTLWTLILVNSLLTLNENYLRSNELTKRIEFVLEKLKKAIIECNWDEKNYPNLCAPFSPCVTLQWTYRDGKLVNLPWALLVRGDVISMRPGQVAPGRCESVENGVPPLLSGQVYQPQARRKDMFNAPRTRLPYKNKMFRLCETPYIVNLRMALNLSCCRPVTVHNKQRHFLTMRVMEGIALPSIIIIIVIVGLIRKFYFYDFAGPSHWTDVFLLQTVATTLPLLQITFPMAWVALNCYGLTRFKHLLETSPKFSRAKSCSISEEVNDPLLQAFSESNLNAGNIVSRWTTFYNILIGKEDMIMRTANIVQVLGSLSALCCIDKKGILSWPNPTAEKVFFLRSSNNLSRSSSKISLNSSDNHVNTSQTQNQRGDDQLIINSALNSRSQLQPSTAVEVLDLTHDQSVAWRVEWDDARWRGHITRLKPLGLAALLNTCAPLACEKYAHFGAHIAAEARLSEDLVPVTNRRCLCELAKQIGFNDEAALPYSALEHLATFRHLQADTIRRDTRFARSLHLNTKVKVPLPHMLGVIVKDHVGQLQLMSQGTADIILDSCIDYWNGHDLWPLSASDRKKILDFYQRSSLTAYCTAFAYKPLTRSVSPALASLYLELPSEWRPPAVAVTFAEPMIPLPLGAHFHSTDSLLFNDTKEEDVKDLEGYFELQCNQVFLGMVTMQYQARSDIVELIERLERACIRFVHFSKENELRSRVFSEKMGLESGWNCHISLLSDSESKSATPTMSQNLQNLPSDDGAYISMEKSCHAKPAEKGDNHCGVVAIVYSNLENSKCMSSSAPGAINVEHSTVKFEPGQVSFNVRNHSITTQTSANKIEFSPTADSAHSFSDDSMLAGGNEGDATTPPEGCRSLSCLTDSTEQSAPVNFDMRNRAKLPRGIENIRPHIERVDNVPLLVSLFTDCTANVTRKMIEIMQDYNEVVCVLGSAANKDNMEIFMQADASVAVEPLYPVLCQKMPPYRVPEKCIGPIELARVLNSISCSISTVRESDVSIFSLVTMSRHFMMCLWNTTQFWMCCLSAVVFLQLLAIFAMVPLPLSPGNVLWLCMFVIPILSTSLTFAPLDSSVMQRAMGKVQYNFNWEAATFVIWCCGCKFIPAMIMTFISYASTLHSLCVAMSALVKNTECNIWYPKFKNETIATPLDWHGWGDVYYDEHLFAQHVCLILVVVHLIAVSLSFIHRESSLWKRGFWKNRVWMVCVILILLSQCIYSLLILSTSFGNKDLMEQLNFTPTLQLEWWYYLLFSLTPLLTIMLNEFIKWQEIKANLRYQRRARLDFGTKLGMNSPF